MNNKNLIWTRSQDDWAKDRKLWEANDSVWHWPLVTHQSVPASLPDWDPQIIFITSQKAFQFAREEPRLQELLTRRLPILTFGIQTWQLVKDCGYLAIHLQAADGHGFVKKILGCYPPSRAWYLTSRKPATPIDELLTRQGWQVSRICMYETTGQVVSPSAELLTAMHAAPSIICFASPSAVSAFGSWLAVNSQLNLQKIHAVAIGPTTAKACRLIFPDCEVSAQSDLGILWKAARVVADSV